MKRVLILFLLMALMLPGCAAKPEQPAAMQKDMEQMVQTANVNSQASDNPNESIAVRFDIPKRYENELEAAEGKLKIYIEADIEVPEVNAIPIVQVSVADFTQEQVDYFFNRFCADKEMFERSNKRAKAEISEIINSLKNDLSDSELSREDKSRLQVNIETLEREYQNAPEQRSEAKTTGKLHEKTHYFHFTGEPVFTYAGIEAYDKDHKILFDVTNNNDLKETLTFKGPNGAYHSVSIRKGAQINYYQARDYENAVTDDVYLRVTDESKVPDAAATSLSLTPSQARERVNELISGMGMQVSHIYIFDPANEKQSRSFYKVFCTREIQDVPCVYTRDFLYAGDGGGSPSWSYETLDVSVDDRGIFELFWNSPLTIGEAIAEDAQLLTFEEIKAIFEKMIVVVNALEANMLGTDFVTINVSHVTLTLQRISEKGSVEKGLLVPVWNFYGKKTKEWNPDGIHQTYIEFDYDRNNQPQSLMSINAIDGSVFDVQKGY